MSWRVNRTCLGCTCTPKTRMATGADIEPVYGAPCPEQARWNMPPYAVQNGLIVGLGAKVLGFGPMTSTALGVASWYFFSGKWWR